MRGKSKTLLCTNTPATDHSLFREYINKIKAKEQEFHDWLQSRPGIAENVKECLRLDIQAIDKGSDDWTELALQSQVSYGSEHQSGWKYWTKGGEDFAAGAVQFLKDFKPFVEFAESSGPYGALAIGTLSAFFAIAQSRAKIDDIVTSALIGVKDRLPGFRMLEEIYRDQNMHQQRLRTKILVTHSRII